MLKRAGGELFLALVIGSKTRDQWMKRDVVLLCDWGCESSTSGQFSDHKASSKIGDLDKAKRNEKENSIAEPFIHEKGRS
jgi:hypothetical protein